MREFNRFYTNVIGLLREGLLDTPYSLAEARILFELARDGEAETANLRRWLDIDAGYLSRLLARFEADGLVTRTRSPLDGRRQVIGLTGTGRAAQADLDARSGTQIRVLLAGLTPDGRRRLTAAMASIREIVGPAPPPAAFVLRPPVPGDLGWVVQRHGALYAAEYGWDASFEALVAQIVADYAARDDHRGEAVWIAELGGEPAGCVFCVRKTDTTAQLRLLLAEPRARGLGMGGRLVAECVWFRPPGRVPRDRAVDQRRAARRPPDLPAGRLPARLLPAAPRLRPRPGGAGLAPAAGLSAAVSRASPAPPVPSRRRGSPPAPGRAGPASPAGCRHVS